MTYQKGILYLLLVFCLGSCTSKTSENKDITHNFETPQTRNITKYDTSVSTIHILVALCDNKYQGIVPVPSKIGNGQDPFNNLYWGCGYGIKTYFKKSKDWELLKSEKKKGIILERIIFKHTSKNYYLVADAYDGKYIKDCTHEFLQSNAGLLKDTVHIDNKVIGINGNAQLISYIGHDGLMDFKLNESYNAVDSQPRDCIILACKSKPYFSEYIKNTKSNPLVWTTGLMAPEAYTIHDALTGYVQEESPEAIRTRAAAAYSKFQKCSLKASKNLLVTGF